MKKTSEDLAKKCASLRVQKTVLKKKVKSLEETLKDIEKDVTAEGFIQLNEKAADIPKSVIDNLKKKCSNPASRLEYDPTMKKFALSLVPKPSDMFKNAFKTFFQRSLQLELSIKKQTFLLLFKTESVLAP